jgi:predicted GNAT family N-acyltransferase
VSALDQAALERVDRIDDDQVDDLMRLYAQAWWSRDRCREDVVWMLRNTDLVIGFREPDGRLIAFARILTDYVYKALLLDVIVDQEHRGGGLGRQLMEAALDHPELASVRHLELYCRPELVPFYRAWGFTDELGELRFMRKTRPR